MLISFLHISTSSRDLWSDIKARGKPLSLLWLIEKPLANRETSRQMGPCSFIESHRASLGSRTRLRLDGRRTISKDCLGNRKGILIATDEVLEGSTMSFWLYEVMIQEAMILSRSMGFKFGETHISVSRRRYRLTSNPDFQLLHYRNLPADAPKIPIPS